MRKRQQYRCGRCGQTGHNRLSCANQPLKENKTPPPALNLPSTVGLPLPATVASVWERMTERPHVEETAAQEKEDTPESPDNLSETTYRIQDIITLYELGAPVETLTHVLPLLPPPNREEKNSLIGMFQKMDESELLTLAVRTGKKNQMWVNVLAESCTTSAVETALLKNPILSERSRTVLFRYGFTRHHSFIRMETTPAFVKEHLAHSPDSGTQFFLAWDEHTPEHVLDELSISDDDSVRASITGNVNASPETLAKLARDNPTAVMLGNLSRNPNTSGETLTYIVEKYSTYREIVTSIATRRNLPPHILEELSHRLYPSIQVNVAANPATPVPVLNRLYSEGDPDVIAGLASNPNLPDSLVQQMLPDYAENFISNRDTPARILDRAAKIVTSQPTLPDRRANNSRPSDTVVRRLAAHPAASPDVLTALADHPDAEVRIHVAANLNTPPQVLHNLTSDVSAQIVQEVAKNPSATPETLDRLSRSRSFRTLNGVAANRNAPAHVLERMVLGCSNDNVLATLMRNPNTPSLTIADVASRNPPHKVLVLIAENPNTPAETLATMPAVDISTRDALARNPSTPRGRIEELADDEDWEVSHVALSRLGTIDYRSYGMFQPGFPRQHNQQ